MHSQIVFRILTNFLVYNKAAIPEYSVGELIRYARLSDDGSTVKRVFLSLYISPLFPIKLKQQLKTISNDICSVN